MYSIKDSAQLKLRFFKTSLNSDKTKCFLQKVTFPSEIMKNEQVMIFDKTEFSEITIRDTALINSKIHMLRKFTVMKKTLCEHVLKNR